MIIALINPLTAKSRETLPQERLKMKRIAIFADGTWNSPEQDHPTNVLQMARAIRPKVGKTTQVAFYDWGVGSDGKKFSGGITGNGIDKNIMDCYRFLVHNFEAGDKLYFFGFSRGAYTVRSLAGLIRNCGLLRRDQAHRIPQAFELYRQRTARSAPGGTTACNFRQQYAVADLTEIEFLGVWDTVGALGVPVPFWGTLGESRYLFHDTSPSRIIRHARHALAIDEDREDFEATLWENKDGIDLMQVWFPGVHSDVGGGYPDRGLSHCASQWIVQEAHRFGLRLEPYYVDSLQPDPLARQHNERRGIYRARRPFARQIVGPLHRSVKQRWDENAHDYQRRSRALRQLLDKVDNDWSRIELTG